MVIEDIKDCMSSNNITRIIHFVICPRMLKLLIKIWSEFIAINLNQNELKLMSSLWCDMNSCDYVKLSSKGAYSE